MKDKVAEIIINGLIAEVYKNVSRDTEYPKDHWWGYKVFIYDGLSDAKENELLKVIEYLYDEGFIPDRRVEYEVIRGEDFL